MDAKKRTRVAAPAVIKMLTAAQHASVAGGKRAASALQKTAVGELVGDDAARKVFHASGSDFIESRALAEQSIASHEFLFKLCSAQEAYKRDIDPGGFEVNSATFKKAVQQQIRAREKLNPARETIVLCERLCARYRTSQVLRLECIQSAPARAASLLDDAKAFALVFIEKYTRTSEFKRRAERHAARAIVRALEA